MPSTFRNRQKSKYVFQILCRISYVRRNVQKHSQFRQSQIMRPYQLPVNSIDIQILPHLYFIIGISRDVVDSGSPEILVVPVESLLFSPSGGNQGEES